MAYHNPFIVNGKIRFPENTNLVRHVEKWAKVRGDKLAYRFLDFSTERDGVERDISWADFSARNRAVGARLQQVTQPGDRVAILCPQNLDYLVSFFGTLYSGQDRGAAVRPGRAGPRRPFARGARRLRPVDDPDHHRRRRRCPQVHPRPFGQGTAARHRRRRGAQRGRLHLAAARRRREHHRLPAVHLRLHPHPDRRADHPPEPAHQRAAGAERAGGHRRRPRVHVAAVLPRHGPDHGAAVVGARPQLHLHDARRVRAPARPLDPRTRAQARRDRRGLLGRAELRVRTRRGARPAPRRRAATGPEQRQGDPQRQRAGEPGVDAQVLRGVCALRAEGDGHQAVLRPGRGDAVRLDHADGREAEGHPRRPGRAEQSALRRGRPPTRRTRSLRFPPARSGSTNGRSSSTPTRPASCRTGRSARSGCTARTWASATGARKKRLPKSSRTSSSRGSASRTPRGPPTTGCGCAPATTAPTTTATSI